jgi:hypothetical protein
MQLTCIRMEIVSICFYLASHKIPKRIITPKMLFLVRLLSSLYALHIAGSHGLAVLRLDLQACWVRKNISVIISSRLRQGCYRAPPVR